LRASRIGALRLRAALRIGVGGLPLAKLVVPVALLVVGVGALVFFGIATGVPEFQVREVATESRPDQDVKVHGLIAAIESDVRPLKFTMKDKEKAGITMAVVCDRPKPDTFQLEYDVAVVGRWDAAAKLFRADQLFTKCPSKYEADEKLGVGSAKAKQAREQAQASEKPKVE
jgi:cytochrome c-type biogenesis protein CcmE